MQMLSAPINWVAMNAAVQVVSPEMVLRAIQNLRVKLPLSHTRPPRRQLNVQMVITLTNRDQRV